MDSSWRTLLGPLSRPGATTPEPPAVWRGDAARVPGGRLSPPPPSLPRLKVPASERPLPAARAPHPRGPGAAPPGACPSADSVQPQPGLPPAQLNFYFLGCTAGSEFRQDLGRRLAYSSVDWDWGTPLPHMRLLVNSDGAFFGLCPLVGALGAVRAGEEIARVRPALLTSASGTGMGAEQP